MNVLLEVIACAPSDCVVAEREGADRIELCSAIEMGGLTPSLGLVETCLAATTLPIMAMVRPRSGGFHYTKDEFDSMLVDARYFRSAGVGGIVFGVLTADRKIDEHRMAKLVEVSEGLETVCHRCFDATDDPFKALQSLKRLGITRVLTSGQEPTAGEGKELIRQLVAQADGEIEILPGSGIKPSNVSALVEFTGVGQVHMTAFKAVDDPSMGCVDIAFNGRSVAESSFRVVDPDEMQAIAREIRGTANPPPL